MPGPAPKNHEGERRGALTVLAYAGRESSSNHSLWLCQCDCGARLTMRSTRLDQGHCGCLGYRRSSERHAAARAKVSAIRRRAIAALGGHAAAASASADLPD